MTNKTELLPCPFCGGPPIETEWMPEGVKNGFVVCPGTGIYLSKSGDCPIEGLEIPLENWNTRADPKSATCANSQVDTPAEDVRAVGEEPVPFGYWRVPNEAPLQGMFLLWDENMSEGVIKAWESRFNFTKLYRHPQRPVVLPEKYDDVLLPFLALMRTELHANAHKGDRPGWLSMDRKTAVLEVFYHMGKLHQAVHRDEAEAIREYAADVANMCMMLTDVCGCLDEFARLNPEIPK